MHGKYSQNFGIPWATSQRAHINNLLFDYVELNKNCHYLALKQYNH